VSHPHGNANSYNTALAFSEDGWLQSFESGAVSDSVVARLARIASTSARRRALNRTFNGIPRTQRSPHVLWESISRIGRIVRSKGPSRNANWYDVLFWGHDLKVSNSIPRDADAVYAYEDAALATFRAAKRHDMTAIYELPLGYYQGVAQEMNRAREDWPELMPTAYEEPLWKQDRKNYEAQIADVIVVASEWARKSLSLSAGAGPKPIMKVPYGTPVEEVTPRTAQPTGPFTVLFAGEVGLRKGVPHLIAAWERLGLKNAHLLLAGSMKLPAEYLSKHQTSFEYLGAIPRAELLEIMKKVDLFAFPSLAEGFGLVIGEAMAAGVPVLTTTNTGGPDLIDDGIEGWCVAAHEIEPLVERLEWASTHRSELFEMGRCARRKAERWTWVDYRREFMAAMIPLLRDASARHESATVALR
jgi:glycosyltransferase involved in cell wall biosynthesis